MTWAYYNEFDPYAAQWLRNLIAAGHIMDGEVDERDIREVSPDDVKGFERVHFFAGIAGWDFALDLAGWEGPVWTGSCPCQPFSAAGQRKAGTDERHLWPAWFRLVRECRPHTVFGEQVEGAVGLGWLDRVFADLEDEDYRCGAAVLGAHSIGAPHIRQRLWWVANSDSRERRPDDAQPDTETNGREHTWGHSETGRLAQPHGGHPGTEGIQRSGEHGQQPEDGGTVRLGEPSGDGWCEERPHAGRRNAGGEAQGGEQRPRGNGATRRMAYTNCQTRPPGEGFELSERHSGIREPSQSSFWSDFDIIPCADGKARRVESGTFPLAHGIPNRPHKLRAYGNAIVPSCAAEFIRAFLEVKP